MGQQVDLPGTPCDGDTASEVPQGVVVTLAQRLSPAELGDLVQLAGELLVLHAVERRRCFHDVGPGSLPPAGGGTQSTAGGGAGTERIKDCGSLLIPALVSTNRGESQAERVGPAVAVRPTG